MFTYNYKYSTKGKKSGADKILLKGHTQTLTYRDKQKVKIKSFRSVHLMGWSGMEMDINYLVFFSDFSVETKLHYKIKRSDHTLC